MVAASIVISCPPLLSERVCGFAVLREIQAESLLRLFDAKRDEAIDGLEDDEGTGGRVGPGDGDREQLDQQLPRIAVEETVEPTRVDGHGGEQAGCDRTPCPPDAVNRPHVEGV